jgi:hypothetical protein
VWNVLTRCAHKSQKIIDIFTNFTDIFENSIGISANINGILSFFGARAGFEGRSRWR